MVLCHSICSWTVFARETVQLQCYHGLLHLKVNLFHITDCFSIAMHKESPQSSAQPVSAKSFSRSTGDPVAARLGQCAFWEI